MTFPAINPATGETIARYDAHSEEDVLAAISRARHAFEDWSRQPVGKRLALLEKVADRLEQNKERYAAMITAEMGKPIQQARGEIDKCAWVFRHYAETAERDLADQPIETENTKSYAAFRPLGPVLAVMPWNFPFWQVLRFAAPAIAAGNVGLLKHASNIPGCALALEELFRDAGAPEGVFQTLMIRAESVAAVIEHPDIAAVTITGSTPAGRNVASTAGENLKKSVLELGGSDPYVVLDDADLEKTVESCIASRLMNTGQTCIAAKRLIVVDKVLDEFTERLVDEMKQKTYGDPMDESVDLGPMARADLRDELHDQVLRSIEGGAECLLGGEIPNIKGAFYPPTVLGNVKIGTPAFEEELFGPVACIVPAADEGEAVRLANDSPFGLGAAVFTRDEARGERIARDEMQAGSCFVNDFVKSDPRLPFGGVKESGYGRELSSFGLREFVNIKTVVVA